MAEKRYADDINQGKSLQTLYTEKACFLPEFSKIIAITYATPTNGENDDIKRNMRLLKDETEPDLIIAFMNALNKEFSEAHNSSPALNLTMCGHNIIGHDIPLLVKRIIKYREPLLTSGNPHIIPPIIKNYLKAKPWESNVFDTVNAWKFNGTDYISLQLISDFIGLKYTNTLLSKEEINRLYWSGIEDDKGSTLENIRNQSANYVNLTIQLVNELRKL